MSTVLWNMSRLYSNRSWRARVGTVEHITKVGVREGRGVGTRWRGEVGGGRGRPKRRRKGESGEQAGPLPTPVCHVNTYLAMFLDVLVFCWLSVQEGMFLTCSNCKSRLSIRQNILFIFFFLHNPNCLYKSDSLCSTCERDSILSQMLQFR